jgi:hypothetical protein
MQPKPRPSDEPKTPHEMQQHANRQSQSDQFDGERAPSPTTRPGVAQGFTLGDDPRSSGWPSSPARYAPRDFSVRRRGAHRGCAAMGELELHVFPCNADKTPACLRGFYAAVPHDKSADLFRRYPGPLTAMATGSISGIDVLDCDIGGEDFLALFEATHGPLPVTTIIGTPSGGVHYHFQHRVGLRCSAGLLSENIDIRSSGGYAIVKGPGYRVLVDAEPAPWPPMMLQLLREKIEAQQAAASTSETSKNSSGVCFDVSLVEGDRFVHPALWDEIRDLMPGAPPKHHRRVRGILRVVAATRSSRNQTLYEGALQFRELIRDGIVGRPAVEQLLFSCMKLNGYVAEKERGEARAWATIASGLNALRFGRIN